MKKIIFSLFVALMLLNVSCSKSLKEQESIDSIGYLATGFDNNVDSTYLQTKAALADDAFWIRVKNTATDSYVYQSTRDRIADILELKIGSYNIEADYPDVKDDAAFEQPHFYGVVENVLIEKDKITKLEQISTSIQNMKVEVEFGPHIKDHFSEYSIILSNNKGELTFNKTTTQPGYYTLSPLKAKFVGQRVESGSIVEQDFGEVVPESNLGKAFHHKIVIDSKFVYPTRSNSNDNDGGDNKFTHHLFVD